MGTGPIKYMSAQEFNAYSEASEIVNKEHFARYRFASRYIHSKRVLEVASGDGSGAEYIARIADHVVAGDCSPLAMQYAKLYDRDNLSFVQLDGRKLPFEDESFDIITSFETIEHIPEYELFLAECHRCLGAGGVLFLSTPNKLLSPLIHPSMGSYWYHHHEFYSCELKALLELRFRCVNLYGQHSVNAITYALKTNLIFAALYILSHLRSQRSLNKPLPLKKPELLNQDGAEILNWPIRTSMHMPLYIIAVAEK